MFRPRTVFHLRVSGILLVGALVLFAIACRGTVGRGTPAPDSRNPATAIPTTTPGPVVTLSPSPRPSPTVTTAPTPSNPTPVRATPSPALTPHLTLPTATPRPPVVTEPVATVSTELSLDIFGIGDETKVRGTSIIVAGRTHADAVLSINGVIIPMDADGRFEVTVALNPGPNLIEVVASDLDGNQKSRVLVVIALPEEA